MRFLAILFVNAFTALLTLFQGAWRAALRPKPVDWVVYDLHGRLDRGDPVLPVRWLWRAPRGARPRSLVELKQELDFLRTTPVKGVVLRLGNLSCGMGVLRELRATLEQFRAGGREVVVHADHLGNREYWLATVANAVWLAPRGRLELIGFAGGSMAAAKPLGRLGIVFDVIRAGAFKSAGELFGSEKVSDAQKQQTEELVGDMNDLFVADVARGRGRTTEQVQQSIDSGPYSARGALEAGLVDGCAYADQVRERLAALHPGGPKRARLGPFRAALASTPPTIHALPWRDRRPIVAVLHIDGIITDGKNRASPWAAATAGAESLVPALARLRLMPEVEAVVLRIDSRGGSAAASDLIWRAALRLNEQKPVIAFLDDVAASGGYYIAAAARRIIAAPTCITGSIGVFMLRPNYSAALDNLEIDRATTTRGARAALYRIDRPLTDDERGALQEQIRETYDDFIRVVAEGRSLSDEKTRELAEGHVYLAGRAKSLGLVDELGTLDDAVRAAAQAAKIEEEVHVVHWETSPGGWRELLNFARGGEGQEKAESIAPQAVWLGERPC